MSTVNLPYPKFKYTIAATAEPGVGYKLFTYEAGTSTKKTTWTDYTKTAENLNPIILDANGEADVWYDGYYKMVLALPEDTDPPTSPVWTEDNIRSPDDTSSSSSVVGETPTNGSFESSTSSAPDDWTVAQLTGGTVAIDDTTSSDGTNSLKFTSTGSGAGTSSTDAYYPVEAGEAIGVRFSIVSANVDTLNKVQVFWYNSSQVYLSTTDVYNNGTTNPVVWTRKYTSATAPATAKYAKIVLTGVDALSTTQSSTNFDNVEMDNGEIGNTSSTLIQEQLDASEVGIQSVDASVAASALTVTFGGDKLSFRSATLGSGTVNNRSLSSDISVVVSSGSTLGTVSAVQSRIAIVAIDNAGTVELAVVNIAGGSNLDETTLISTTAEGGAGAADSDNVFYSTTARSNVPFRVVGYIESTQTTPGTWVTTPSTIQGVGGNAFTAMQSIGFGQTWQSVTGSRALSTTYYNTTGKPIYINVSALPTSNVGMEITVDGITIDGNTTDSGTRGSCSAIVPPSASYSAAMSGGSSLRWRELR